MAYPIRQTTFTWDPQTESRGHVWDRIKGHVQAELDRIHAAAVLQRRLARRRAHPQYARNQQIVQALRGGVSVDHLATTHGLRVQHVRDIIRSEQRWTRSVTYPASSLRDAHPARCGSGIELRVMPAATHQTHTVVTDP